MKKRLQDRSVDEIKRDLIECNLARLQPGDELGRRREIKLAEIHARQLHALVCPRKDQSCVT